jgi:deazaflavin-dependent oxidoreductase (nitroreductase family)
MVTPFLAKFFWFFNKIFMVPIFRLGLGSLFGNPFWGYMMVLKTTGRKSGKVRFSPVNYTIMNGTVYCLAGRGQMADWYRNMVANPNIEMILPGGALAGVVDEVPDSPERTTALRRVLKAGGFAGFMLGENPYTVSDEKLAEKSKDLPLMRIKPTGIGSGASDPGGWLWIPVLALLILLAVR